MLGVPFIASVLRPSHRSSMDRRNQKFIELTYDDAPDVDVEIAAPSGFPSGTYRLSVWSPAPTPLDITVVRGTDEVPSDKVYIAVRAIGGAGGTFAASAAGGAGGAAGFIAAKVDLPTGADALADNSGSVGYEAKSSTVPVFSVVSSKGGRGGNGDANGQAPPGTTTTVGAGALETLLKYAAGGGGGGGDSSGSTQHTGGAGESGGSAGGAGAANNFGAGAGGGSGVGVPGGAAATTGGGAAANVAGDPSLSPTAAGLGFAAAITANTPGAPAIPAGGGGGGSTTATAALGRRGGGNGGSTALAAQGGVAGAGGGGGSSAPGTGLGGNSMLAIMYRVG